MSGNRSGFTLIEILIAIALVALMAALIVPNFYRRGAAYKQKQFLSELNALMGFAYQNALRNNTIQKIAFDLQNGMVSVQESTGKQTKEGDPEFRSLEREYRKTTVTIPENLEVRNFIIEGFDEMGRSMVRETTQTWFYIMPDGVTQDVIINILDTKDDPSSEPARIGLVLNPFSAQFEQYDEFQK